MIATQGFKGAHFATFPEALVEKCIRPSCSPGGVVLDPFAGSGTTCVVAKRLGRHFIGIDLKPKYVAIAKQRVWPVSPETSEKGGEIEAVLGVSQSCA